MKVFVLPQGLKLSEEEDGVLRELPIAPTTGEAEKVFTKKPNNQTLYSWFGRIVSAAVESIDGVPVSVPFLKDATKQIPDAVKNLTIADVGSLLIQIQRECWQPVIENQQIKCTSCGANLSTDVELHRIEVEVPEEVHPFDVKIALGSRYKVVTGLEAYSEYEGKTYDTATFRAPTLRDALKYEKIAQDEVNFWRRISLDCLLELSDSESGEVLGMDFINKRGMVLMNKDWNTITLKNVRFKLQTSYPSAKFFYEDECDRCGAMTPFFASVQNFFSA